MADERSDNDLVMIVLAYLGPLDLIPYLTAEDNESVRWHAKQGLTLSVLHLICTIVLPLLIGVEMLFSFLNLAFIAIIIVAILRATKGDRWRIPIVADLSEKW